MADELSARLLRMFAEELVDQLREANEHLLALEKNPADGDRLRSLFRVMHTLKGAARSADVPDAERVAHRLEGLLALARDHGRALTRVELDELFTSVDQLSAISNALGGASASMSGDPATPSAPAAESSAAGSPAGEAALRVAQERVDELFGMSNRLLVFADRLADVPNELHQLQDSAARASALWRRVRHVLAGTPGAATLTSDIEALDEALDTTRRSSTSIAADVTIAGRGLTRISTELSRSVRELRMRPFADALVDLPRIARDVATSTGKRVDLAMDGGEVQADRVVLTHIHEALLHLVRNAVDHGIEAPEVRRARGKPEVGQVRVTAALVGDRIVVSVSDDGAGLDLASIRRQLAERSEEVPNDDRAVARRLFAGGLSTRHSATAISGRGVGLDAVRAAVERIRGGVDVATRTGEGTTFTIDAPLTLATVRAVLVRVSGAYVAIPSAFVERLVRLGAEAIRVVEGRPAMDTGATPAVIAPLAAILGPPLVDRPSDDDTRRINVVLVSVGARRVALRVDEVLEETEVVVRPIRAHAGEALPHVSGAAMLPTGDVALVLNATSAVATALGYSGLDGTLAPAVTRTAERRRIIVVDDSITTRTLLASVLEAAGYDVITAVDGADAWRLLQERGANLIVSDVEMPRMDGFQLTEAVRATARFRELPLILVTAMESAEHRSRGLEAGADAYLGKSSFEQEALLTTVRDLLG